MHLRLDIFSLNPSLSFLILHFLGFVTCITHFLKGVPMKHKCLKVALVHLENGNMNLNAVKYSED